MCGLLQEMVRLLLLSLHRPTNEPPAGHPSDGEDINGDAAKPGVSAAAARPQECQSVHIPWDCCQDFIAKAAIPISVWL